MPIPYAVKWRARELVTRLGADSPRLDVLHSLPKLRTWERQHVPDRVPRFPRRLGLYQHLAGDVLGPEPVDFLEFGVYRGESLTYWTDLVDHPDSRFIGFDTFAGLPEDWHYFGGTVPATAFDAGGDAPDLGDQRVSFVKGLFQDIVPAFLADFEPRSRVVVHCDADLYSSTLYVLTQLDSVLEPGSIVIFDEFAAVMHEFSALRDYCSAYRRTYKVLAATERFAHVAIELD